MREYASSIESGNNQLVELHICEGSSGKFQLIEDDGISNDYLNGVYAVTKIEYEYKPEESKIKIYPVDGFFEGMGESRKMAYCVARD